jgi:DNA polymerase/3'-5' exonuclease PolX
MSDKVKFPRAIAMKVAAELCNALKPFVAFEAERLAHRTLERKPLLKVCGSLRRGKDEVGDVEIVYVSTEQTFAVQREGEMFTEFSRTTRKVRMADAKIEQLLEQGALQKRPNAKGGFTWGDWNKLAIHTATGVPVDFFATTWERYWMTCVIRTGPKELNLRLIDGARKNGLQLHAYGTFTRISTGEELPVTSERDVFEKCGVPWMEPKERNQG